MTSRVRPIVGAGLALLALPALAAEPGVRIAQAPAIPAPAAQAPTTPATTTLTIAAGSPKGVYAKYAAALKDKVESVARDKGVTPPTIVIATTNGSLDNINRLQKGQAQIAPVQPDVFYVFNGSPSERLTILADLHEEYVFLLCNRAADIGGVGVFEDQPGKLIVVGTGAALTWRAWQTLDSDYTKTKPLQEPSAAVALQKIVSGAESPCLLYVAGLNNDLLKIDAAKVADKVVLTKINDNDFNDAKDFRGRSIYTFSDVPKNTYGKLQPGGFINDAGPETLKLRAMLVADKGWLAAHPEARDLLAEALLEMGNVAEDIAAGKVN